LKTFFPLLSENIEDKPIQEQHALFEFLQLTMQKVETKVFGAKSGKAPEDDRLSVEVWKHLWLVVKERVL
jgi:hypothetical protein